jgi:hypothetical protein
MDRRLPGEIWLAINAHQDHGPPSRAYLPAVSRALREYLLPSFWKVGLVISETVAERFRD